MDQSQGQYDGEGASVLARRWGSPLVIAMRRATSTFDVAHELAQDGAPFGAVVIADEQTAGRGRGGKRWRSESGQGVWLTTIERAPEAAAVEVLSLRVGLSAAAALEPFAEDRIAIKWPNDLLVGGAKLAGILIEARWREGVAEWVAIGVGVNVRPPGLPAAVGLRAGTGRLAVLDALVPALRGVAASAGPLTDRELAELTARDATRSRFLAAPVVGRAEGISATGELLVVDAEGTVHRCRSGSLVFKEEG